MLLALLVTLMIFSAIQAIRAPRLLISAVWLAGVSALLSIFLYNLGATTVAVIELSVGAGLVTVLLVFAISISGEETLDRHTSVPRLAAGGLIAALVVLLGGMILNGTPAPVTNIVEAPFSMVFWQQRDLDILVQLVVVFAGVLTVLGLLNDIRIPQASAARGALKEITPPACEETSVDVPQVPVKEPAL